MEEYKNSADTLFKLERYEEALAAYNEAIVRNPTIGSWYNYRAEVKKRVAVQLLTKSKELLDQVEEEKRTSKQIKDIDQTHE